jgi:hypothetical protein
MPMMPHIRFIRKTLKGRGPPDLRPNLAAASRP